MMMVTFMEFKGHQRSNVVHNDELLLLPNLEESLMHVYYDDHDFHGGQVQRSNVMKYVILLPNLVRRIPDESLS